MVVLLQEIYAQEALDMDKNPAIVMDKHIVAVDRQVLKSAQASGSKGVIKSARQKLLQDIRKMLADKKGLENSRGRK